MSRDDGRRFDANAQHAHVHSCACCAKVEFTCTHAHTPLGVCMLCTPCAAGNMHRPPRPRRAWNPPLSGLVAVAHPGAAIAAPVSEPASTEDGLFAGHRGLAPIGARPAPLTSPDRGGLERCGFGMQSKLERSDHLHDGGELRVTFGRKRLVKPFAGDACVAGQLAHAPSPRNRSKGDADEAAVSRVVLDAGVQVGGHVLVGLQEVRRVVAREFFSHCSILPVLGNVNRPFDVRVLRPFVATGEQHDHQESAPYEVDAVARAIVDPEFRHAVSQGPGVARVPKRQTVKASLDTRPSLSVLEAVQPMPESLALNQFHHPLHSGRAKEACQP